LINYIIGIDYPPQKTKGMGYQWALNNNNIPPPPHSPKEKRGGGEILNSNIR
jgi:hypothetical protein